MFKLLGAVLIGAGCLGLGLWKKEQLCARVRVLKELHRILALLRSEIRYGKATLPECCRQIGVHMVEPYRSCLADIFTEMQENTGERFEPVFVKHFESCLKEEALTKEDKELFFGFLTIGSYTDGKMQQGTMEQVEEKLRDRIKDLETENVEKSRMAVALGAMSGLFLVIVLI